MTVLKICAIWVLTISSAQRRGIRSDILQFISDVSFEEREEHHLGDPGELSNHIRIIGFADRQLHTSTDNIAYIKV